MNTETINTLETVEHFDGSMTPIESQEGEPSTFSPAETAYATAKNTAGKIFHKQSEEEITLTEEEEEQVDYS